MIFLKIKEVKYEKASRKDFAKVGDYIEMPNLIKVQKDSYDWFIEEGLGEVLKDISPIEDYSGNLVLEFFDYYMEEKTKYSVEEAKERHNMSPIATVALGRLLTGGAMMGAMMKNDADILTVQIKGNGPIGSMTVTANPKGEVKGFVGNPQVMLPLKDGKLDIADAVGIGVLSVIKDIGLKEPYVGDTILITSEIADDLTYYFANSEQVPSSVGLGVLMNKDNTVEQAGGFIIQLMPGATDEFIDKLEARIKEIKSVTAMLEEGMTPEQILEHILGDMELDILDTIPTKFYCNCSKDRVSKAVISVGKEEIQKMIDDGEPIEVNCHFCNSHYTFTVDELKKMYDCCIR